MLNTINHYQEKLIDCEGYNNADKIALMLSRKFDFNEEYLEELNTIIKGREYSYEELLGKIIFQRINGVVYNVMRNNNIFIHREFNLALELLYKEQVRRNGIYYNEILKICKNFNDNNILYCLLKGSVLNYFVYSQGERISNDIDILVSSKFINIVSETLLSMGYVQGYYNEQTKSIKLATKEEVFYARLNTHELVQFIKIDEVTEEPIKIDINFKLDGIYSLNLTDELLRKRKIISVDKSVDIYSLSWNDFYVHLCTHFYRETIMSAKIKKSSDLSMYKLLDFYYLISKKMVDIKLINTEYKNTEFFEAIKATSTYLHYFYPVNTATEIFDSIEEPYLNYYVDNVRNSTTKIWGIPFKQRLFNEERWRDLEK